MVSGPYNQAEAMTRLLEGEKQIFEVLLKREGEIIEFLNWADLPQTKKVRKAFADFEAKVLKTFKENKWEEEAEARAIAYLLQFTGIIDETIISSQKAFKQIQERKQKKEQ